MLRAISQAAHDARLRLARLPHEEAVALMEDHLQTLAARLLHTPAYTTRPGFSHRDLRSLDDLRHAPLTSREDLARDLTGHLHLEPPYEARRLIARTTGTRSGTPLEVVRDALDQRYRWDVLRTERVLRALPSEPEPLRALFLCTLPRVTEYRASLPHTERGELQRISTFAPSPLERVVRARPHVISTDPGGLRWLLERRPRLPELGLVMSAATALPAALRRAWTADRPRAHLIDVYALTELGAVAVSCPTTPDRFHALCPDVWVESVAGELVVTRLRQGGLTLLRYRTGDAGEVRWRDCEGCGRRGWCIEGLRGRAAEPLRAPTGGTVDAWRLAWVTRDLNAPWRLIQQADPSRFRLETLATNAGMVASALEEALKRLGWTAPEVRHEARAPQRDESSPWEDEAAPRRSASTLPLQSSGSS